MLKKLIAIFTVLTLATVSSCGSKEVSKTMDTTKTDSVSESKELKIGYVTGTSGLGDQGFNDAINLGLTNAVAKNPNIKLTTIVPKDAGSIESSIRTLARDNNELIFVGASDLEDGTKVVSSEFPNVKFIQMDGSLSDVPNVMSLVFNEEEAAYLVGTFTALMSDSKVGFIGGANTPIIKKFEAGYVAGANGSGKKDGDVLVAYTNTFGDPALGKETATALSKNGASYIFTCAGACNLGVFESSSTEDFIPLGAATGQFDKSDNIVASHIKSVDTLCENILNKYAQDKTFTSGIVKNGLKEGGVDFRYNPKNEELGVIIPDEVKAKVEEAREKIISGEIKVPSTPVM